MIFDTHCHPYYAKKKTREEILERFFVAENKYLISVGVDRETSLKSIEIAKQYPNAYASIGIHPVDALKYRNNSKEVLEELEIIYRNNSENIVAIGEAGLDYHWRESLSQEYNIPSPEVTQIQKYFFRAQIGLSKKLSVPLIIHNRDSAQDIFQILQEEDFKNFVFHCYSEDILYAEKLLEFAPNCMLGFGGVTTFNSAKDISNTASIIPLKNILLETDSPYLTPSPLRGKEENEPDFTKYILSHIIDIRKESPEKITKTIFENSLRFFGIEKLKS